MKKQTLFWIPLLAGVLFLYSCSNSGNELKNGFTDSTGNKILARVQDRVLYVSDITGVIPSNTTKSDSIKLVDNLIQSWVRKQLLYRKALEDVSSSNKEINKKLDEYKYSLYVYEYEKQFLEDHIDTLILEQDIVKMYKEDSSNFLLKQVIFRGLYVKAPVNHPNWITWKKNIQNYKGKNQPTLPSIVEWLDVPSQWNDLYFCINNTPIESVLKNQSLKSISGKLIEASDKEFTYVLFVKEIRLNNEVAPYEMVKNQVKAIILNKKKFSLLHELEENVYNEGLKSKSFEIYK